MARAPPELIPCTPSGIGSCMSTPICHDSRRVWSGWSTDFCRPIILWEGAYILKSLGILLALGVRER